MICDARRGSSQGPDVLLVWARADVRTTMRGKATKKQVGPLARGAVRRSHASKSNMDRGPCATAGQLFSFR